MSVPKLRFPEFKDAWESQKLKNISKEINRTSEKSNVEILTISAGKGFITQKERWNKVIAGNSLKKYTFLKKNEFSYNRGNSKRFPYGCIYRLKDHESALVPNVYRSFSVEEQKPLFYEQFFIGGHVDRQLNKLISSSARMDGLLNISKKDFFDVEVPVPTIQEQEKIGTFLSKVDEKIEKLEKKQELWETYKKGIMQQIFSQKIRFKDENGEEYPDWEEKKLEEIAKFSKGKGISKNDISNEGIECIRYGELYTTYKEEIKEVVSKTNLKVNELVLSDENDIIIPTSGETAIDIATASCIMKRNVAIGGDTTIIKTKENGLFLSYYLNSQRNKIASLAQGVSVVHLYSNQLKELELQIPIIKEQIKIAHFLSATENRIIQLNKELEITREFKKGLLQQMFC